MRHLYVHVPFCARRCVYCDFAIAVRREVPWKQFVDAIGREWNSRSQREPWEGELETVYLGGGTPSLLPVEALAQLLSRIAPDAPRASPTSPVPPQPPQTSGNLHHSPAMPVEVSLEANPDDVTPERAREWAQVGISRVSLGAQSFDERVLRWMHRTHGIGATERAVDALRAAGVASVSLDLIFGLPRTLGHDFPRDLDVALALEPDHLSVYGLTVEPGTALGKWVRAGSTTPVDDERYADEFVLAHRRLTSARFEHYEVSNYARGGHRSRHNSAYWTHASYVGLGPSAHSLLGGERRWNERHWAAYLWALAERGDPRAGREMLTATERQLESVYLGLRTSDGIPAHLLASLQQTTVDQAVTDGWLRLDGDRVRPTVEGWLRLDALVAGLTPASGGR